MDWFSINIMLCLVSDDSRGNVMADLSDVDGDDNLSIGRRRNGSVSWQLLNDDFVASRS